MVRVVYLPVAAAFAALAAVADAGALSAGVCYAPWHHSSVTSDVVASDFATVSTYFSSVRTFQTLFSSVNAIEAAAAAGLKIAAGVQLTDASLIQSEIDAVCSAAASHADAIEAVYVGNEDLKNADGSFGTFSADTLIGYIQQVQACVGDSIPVGTVQRINEWLETDNAASLAAACDVIGVNIYPFFTNGDQSAVEKLEIQYQQLVTAGYDASKLHVTETGWPYAGSSYSGNTPSYEGMQTFIDDFATWSSGVQTPYYFMMFDTTTSYSGADYETHFGLFGSDGTTQHVTIPSGNGTTTATTTTTTSTTGSVSTYSSDSTDDDADDSASYEDNTDTAASTTAETTQVTDAPVVTPAATTSTDTTATTETPATTEAPAATPATTTTTDESTTTTTATEAPAATPAATTTAVGSSKNCKM